MQKKVLLLCLCRCGTTATLGVIESASGSFRGFLPIVKLRVNGWTGIQGRRSIPAMHLLIFIFIVR